MLNAELFVGFKCPKCQTHNMLSISDIDSANGATTDCISCGQLYLCEDGKVWGFNAKLHESEPDWPADGANTGVIGT